MRSVLRWLQARAENVAALLLAVMFCAFMLQIVSRYVFNAPIIWTQELCLTAWLWAVFWGAAFTVREREHVKFDMLYVSAGLPVRRTLALLAALGIAGGFLASLPASWDYISFNKIKSSATLGIRMDIVFSIYAVFAVAVIVRYVLRAVALLRGVSPDTLDRTPAP